MKTIFAISLLALAACATTPTASIRKHAQSVASNEIRFGERDTVGQAQRADSLHALYPEIPRSALVGQ